MPGASTCGPASVSRHAFPTYTSSAAARRRRNEPRAGLAAQLALGRVMNLAGRFPVAVECVALWSGGETAPAPAGRRRAGGAMFGFLTGRQRQRPFHAETQRTERTSTAVLRIPLRFAWATLAHGGCGTGSVSSTLRRREDPSRGSSISAFSRSASCSVVAVRCRRAAVGPPRRRAHPAVFASDTPLASTPSLRCQVAGDHRRREDPRPRDRQRLLRLDDVPRDPRPRPPHRRCWFRSLMWQPWTCLAGAGGFAPGRSRRPPVAGGLQGSGRWCSRPGRTPGARRCRSAGSPHAVERPM